MPAPPNVADPSGQAGANSRILRACANQAPMSPLSYPAPAKINLFLHVTGRRPDGYHLLQTVFRFLDFGDTLYFRVRQDGIVRRVNTVPGVAPEEDISVHAARLLRQETGVKRGVEIRVHKALPLGGGLGGGSSDAATTLLALNQLWNLHLTRRELAALGVRLGADVPVFIFGESAFGEGIGEQLQPISLPPAWYLVLVPPVAVATRKVFEHPDLTRNSPPVTITAFSVVQGQNDLESVVCAVYPEVGRHLYWLRGHGGESRFAALTGSGACVFAECATETEARGLAGLMPEGMRGFVAQGLDRHPLRNLAD
jgi:4-diphosphocytidyl-2-C-methyl-D-erythritol kinase